MIEENKRLDKLFYLYINNDSLMTNNQSIISINADMSIASN